MARTKPRYNPRRMDNEYEADTAPRRRFRKRWIFWGFVAIWVAVGLWQTTKPMPAGTEQQTAAVAVDAANVQFLTDLIQSTAGG